MEHKAAQEIFSKVESCMIIHVWIMVRFYVTVGNVGLKEDCGSLGYV